MRGNPRVSRGSALILFLILCILVESSNAGFLDSLFGGGDSSEKKKPKPKDESNKSPSGEGGAPDPNKPVSEDKGLEYLQQFGYVEPGKLTAGGGGGGDTEDIVKAAVKKFQAFAGLDKTGVMDIKTRKKMAAPRCGMLDVQNIGGQAMWKKPHLTYYIKNYSPDIPRQQQNEAIKRAYGLWSQQVPLDFTETKDSSSADITVQFASGSHDDPWPFDGRGGVLAHATFPTSGKLHFDESENWVYMDAAKISGKSGSTRYTDLFPVAIHEIGHTLGLEHSKAEKAIMAPFYQETVDSSGRYVMPKLESDDIRAVKAIYGSKSGGSTRPSSSSSGGSSSGSRPTSSSGSRPSSGSSDRFGNSDPFAGFGSSSGGRKPSGTTEDPFASFGSFGGSRSRLTPSRGNDDDRTMSGGFLSGLLNKWSGRGWDDPMPADKDGLKMGERPLVRLARSARVCPKTVDAVSAGPNSSRYIFVDSKVHKFGFDGLYAATFSLRKLFPNGPLKVEAALFNDRTNSMLLVNDQKVYKFHYGGGTGDFFLDAGFPKQLPKMEFWPTGGITWINGQQFLFSDSDDFAVYDDFWNQAVKVGKLGEDGVPMSILAKLPRGVKGGFQGSDAYVLIFTDSKVFLYDAVKEVMIDSPKSVTSFLDCPAQ